MSPEAESLVQLGRTLARSGYEFVTVTPETHRRVNLRTEAARARTLRDVFGWSRPFDRALLPNDVFGWLERAGALEVAADGFRARVRFSTLGGQLFVHSAFPTLASDAVFFGPDTYRFCALLARWAPAARRAIDIGCGSGAGGLVLRDVAELVLADVNPRALVYAEVNAALAGRRVSVVQSDVLAGATGDFDLIIANPPYMRDTAGRTYRDGGGSFGEALSVRIVREGLARLTKPGTLIVYTGAAVVAGVDQFRAAVLPLAADRPELTMQYQELDPDVFGEELAVTEYAQVERIAAVGLRVDWTLGA